MPNFPIKKKRSKYMKNNDFRVVDRSGQAWGLRSRPHSPPGCKPSRPWGMMAEFETVLRPNHLGWPTRLRVVVYRKRVFHRTAKNFQLDLFSPDNGTWEYSAVATNLDLEVRRLWHFMAG